MERFHCRPDRKCQMIFMRRIAAAHLNIEFREFVLASTGRSLVADSPAVNFLDGFAMYRVDISVFCFFF